MIYVEISESVACGKIVQKPSSAAFPGLSVTPGLKPIVITQSGAVGNISELLIASMLVDPISMIGSVNKSLEREEISSPEISDFIRNPTILRTSDALIPWSESNCRRAESPRTSRIPSPCFGVTSTRVTTMIVHRPPMGGVLQAITYAL